MPETNSEGLEGISSLVSGRETQESIAPLKRASEAVQAPQLMIPVTSGRVYEKSHRPTEDEATMYNAISLEDYRSMRNLSSKDSPVYQLEDRDTGALITVRAEDVRKVEGTHKASPPSRPAKIDRII